MLPKDELPREFSEVSPAMKKIKIEVVEHSGWWRVKVCGLRHSRYRWRVSARHAVKRLTAHVKKLGRQARSRAGQFGQRLRVAHCELYCIRTLLDRGSRKCIWRC
jgi:hypothetical protein